VNPSRYIFFFFLRGEGEEEEMQIASMPRPFDRGWRVGSKESKQASPKIVWLVKVVSPSPACVR
jgi:hypothetical protein